MASLLVKLQRTTLPRMVVVPCETATDCSAVLGGKTLVTVMGGAGLGPLLLSETV